MVVAGKKVLVFGTGISGIGAVKLLEDHGAQIVLFDGNVKADADKIRERLRAESKAEIIIGTLPEEVIKELDLAVLSPGVPTDLPVVNQMREKGIPIWGCECDARCRNSDYW